MRPPEPELIKPPLKWAGGKRWLVPHIVPLWKAYANHRLVEPFCGGLAVTLGLNPKDAVVNDINSHLINFYAWLKRGLPATVEFKNSREAFIKNRARFNFLIETGDGNSAESAQLFYYLNRTGFNGLCRFNGSGKFNVPFGIYNRINYVTDFSKFKAVFKRWKFTCVDFEKLQLKKTDFCYADPPYDVEFTSYSAGGFSWDDQVRLVDWLAKQKCPIVLSNQATERIKKLYSDHGFKLRFLNAPRRISCNGDRTPAKEVLATKNI